jgi:hypothetical protein
MDGSCLSVKVRPFGARTYGMESTEYIRSVDQSLKVHAHAYRYISRVRSISRDNYEELVTEPRASLKII